MIPGLGRSPGAGHGNTLQYSCLENPHGQRSLVGYSPWGHKESDTTEQLSTMYTIICSVFLFYLQRYCNPFSISVYTDGTNYLNSVSLTIYRVVSLPVYRMVNKLLSHARN